MRVRIFVQEPSLPGRPGVFRAEADQFDAPTRYGWGHSPAEAEAWTTTCYGDPVPWTEERLWHARCDFFGFIFEEDF